MSTFPPAEPPAIVEPPPEPVVEPAPAIPPAEPLTLPAPPVPAPVLDVVFVD
jgi:hypothetical protein